MRILRHETSMQKLYTTTKLRFIGICEKYLLVPTPRHMTCDINVFINKIFVKYHLHKSLVGQVVKFKFLKTFQNLNFE